MKGTVFYLGASQQLCMKYARKNLGRAFFLLCNIMCFKKYSCQRSKTPSMVLPIHIYSVEDTLRVDEIFKLPRNSPSDLENASTLVDVPTSCFACTVKRWLLNMYSSFFDLLQSASCGYMFPRHVDSLKSKTHETAQELELQSNPINDMDFFKEESLYTIL